LKLKDYYKSKMMNYNQSVEKFYTSDKSKTDYYYLKFNKNTNLNTLDQFDINFNDREENIIDFNDREENIKLMNNLDDENLLQSV